MKKDLVVTLAVVLGIFSAAEGALLRMQWRGLGPDDAELEIALHETAIIDIYVELYRADETLAELSFKDSDLYGGPIVTQTATEALLPGWEDLSVDGTFGSAMQLVEWVAEPGRHMAGPAEYLIGAQTIRLDALSPRGRIPITFDYFHVFLFDDSGDSYTYAPGFDSLPGYFGIGLGKPQSPGSFGINWNPLYIITVPEPSSLALFAIGAVAVLRTRGTVIRRGNCDLLRSS